MTSHLGSSQNECKHALKTRWGVPVYRAGWCTHNANFSINNLPIVSGKFLAVRPDSRWGAGALRESRTVHRRVGKSQLRDMQQTPLQRLKTASISCRNKYRHLTFRGEWCCYEPFVIRDERILPETYFIMVTLSAYLWLNERICIKNTYSRHTPYLEWMWHAYVQLHEILYRLVCQ